MSATTDNKSSANASANGPDIKQLAGRELPKATFPADGKSEFRIALDEKVHKEIQKHAKDNKQVEICGVLVGKLERDDKGPFVHISGSIRGEAATNKFAEVTFTHDTWSKINAEMDKNYAGYNMVGWYHTHPDFGIFLSERDRFIHESFFSDPGHVAYVVDPVRDIEGFFIWQAGKPVPAPYYWTGEKMRTAPAEKDPRTMSMRGDEKRGGGSSGASGSSSSERGKEEYAGEGPLGWLTLVLGGMCVFMLGFMLSNFWVASQAARLLEGMQNSVGALQIMQRMNLAPKLANASLSLRESAIIIDQLSRNTGPLDDTQKQLLAQEMSKLVAASNDLDQAERQYGVTNGEFAALAALASQTQIALDNAHAAATQPTTQPAALAASATTKPAH